jgi:thiosulfate/3-mercaptopyruvate sulfurtransferase
MTSVPSVSTADLAAWLERPNLAIVDARPIAGFNGWRLQGEARGGHIRGAKAFPTTWLDQVKPEDVESLLAGKGITRDKTIVVYGYTDAEAAPLAERLQALGYPNVLVYADGLAAWAEAANLPMDRLPNYEKLVSPEWLHRLINGEAVEAAPRNGFVLFHVNFGVPEEYADGHLPGALYLDTNSLEARETWNRRTPAELEAALLTHGVTKDTTVIVYGRDTVGDPNEKWPGRRAGQIAAARAALISLYAGVEDVRLLNGGYDAWVIAGYELETVERKGKPAAAFGTTIPARPELFLDLPEAKDLLADPGGALVAIRTWEEHVGNVSGYNYIGPRGRIPGSVWGNCGSDAYHMQHYRNVDNTMRDFHEIAANWRDGGITPDKHVSFYCGTGWRASETFFYAYLMGWPRVSVYDGGWFEWSGDPANPTAVGQP